MQSVEQNVDIPVPVARVEQNLDIPVPGSRGRPAGGLQNFVPGQSSPARGRGPQESFDDFLRPSEELVESSCRYLAEEEEAEEEETEEMDHEEQPSRFQGHFRQRRYCASFLSGGLCWWARRVRLRTRTTSSTRTCRDSGDGGVVVDAPVIKQPH